MRRVDSTQISGGRRAFVGGSDARIIISDDEAALVRLWLEKRGEIEPEDLSGDLLVQLGSATEPLNRHWFEKNTGHVVTEVQRQVFHNIHRWMAATLDGQVEATGAVFEAKFMLPWNFSEEAAAEKHMAQLQHNMWVIASRTAVLSIITGGGKWMEMTIRIFNQMTEAFRVIEIANLISGLTGVPIEHLDNPRKEAASNELHVENRGLIGLGLQPITLDAGLLVEITEIAKKYAGNCDRSKIPCTSRW